MFRNCVVRFGSNRAVDLCCITRGLFVRNVDFLAHKGQWFCCRLYGIKAARTKLPWTLAHKRRLNPSLLGVWGPGCFTGAGGFVQRILYSSILVWT